jgi:hypothetical protein
MSRRAQPYSKVLQGARKDEARTKYLAFLAGKATRPDKIGTRGKRPPSIALAVNPFGLPLGAQNLQGCSASKVAVVAFQTVPEYKKRAKLNSTSGTVAGISLDISGSATVIKDVRVDVARVIRKIYATDTATAKTSEITGLRYGYKKSESISAPFGQKAAGAPGDPVEGLITAFAQISPGILAGSPKPELTVVNLVPEIV